MKQFNRANQARRLPIAVALPFIAGACVACGSNEGNSSYSGGTGGVATGASSSGGASASANTGGTASGPLGGAGNPGSTSGSTGGAVGSVDGGKLAIGQRDHCAIDSQGALICWDSLISRRAGPYVAASAGAVTTCMLRSDQDDECTGSVDTHPGTDVFIAIRTGQNHACAQRADRTITCWGEDFNGSVSQVTTEPVDSFSTGFKTCVAKAGSVPQCWGGGQGTPPNVELKNLQATDEITCGVSLEGMVYCWGTKDFASTNGGFVKAKMAFNSADSWGCAQRTTNLLACWGTAAPVTTAELANLTIVDFDLSNDGVCVILTDGSVRCWGTDVGTPPADLRVF